MQKGKKKISDNHFCQKGTKRRKEKKKKALVGKRIVSVMFMDYSLNAPSYSLTHPSLPISVCLSAFFIFFLFGLLISFTFYDRIQNKNALNYFIIKASKYNKHLRFAWRSARAASSLFCRSLSRFKASFDPCLSLLSFSSPNMLDFSDLAWAFNSCSPTRSMILKQWSNSTIFLNKKEIYEFLTPASPLLIIWAIPKTKKQK